LSVTDDANIGIILQKLLIFTNQETEISGGGEGEAKIQITENKRSA
jgi:hypothetical protein